MVMETVTMTHSTLPGREVHVPASAVAQWQRAGWERVETPVVSHPHKRAKATVKHTTQDAAEGAAETHESEH